MLRYALKIASAVVIALTFLSYLAPHVNPSWFQGMAFFGTAFPWFLLLNIVFVVMWAWRWHRFALYHLGILIVGWQWITCFIGFNIGNHPAPKDALVIATHNVGHLWPAGKSDDAAYVKLARDYAAYFQKNGAPDILCTQETRGKFYKALAREMGYPYNFNLKKGTVILSKYPIAAGGEIPFKGTRNSSLWVDVTIAEHEVVRIYNIHLQSNKVTADTEKMLHEGDINESQTWEEVGHVLDKVGGATKLRAEQTRRLREHIEACKHRVIVCGDFNDTPNSYTYHTLSNGFIDTFQEKGFGFGTTFSGSLPFLRIDYILCSPDMKTYDCKVVKGDYSDHYPVISTIGL